MKVIPCGIIQQMKVFHHDEKWYRHCDGRKHPQAEKPDGDVLVFDPFESKPRQPVSGQSTQKYTNNRAEYRSGNAVVEGVPHLRQHQFPDPVFSGRLKGHPRQTDLKPQFDILTVFKGGNDPPVERKNRPYDNYRHDGQDNRLGHRAWF